MCVVIHGSVREGGSVSEDAPRRCSPFMGGESKYEHGARDAVTPRLASPQQTLVPVVVCVLMHVGGVIRKILHHNRSDRLCRLRCR